jgi:hypothetical protein
MAEFKSMRRSRVFVPQALGADEFLRVTWHENDRVMVFSHWQGEMCVAATPVRVTDTGDLTALLVDALGDAARNPVPIVAPRPATLRDRFLSVFRRRRRDQLGAFVATRRWTRSA